MTNKIEMPKHADAFIDCGYSCEVGEVTAKAVFELLGSESAVMEAGSTSSYQFATREQGAAFYHAHKEDALIVNEKLAYLIWGKTLADAIDFQYKDDSIANSSQAQFIIDGKPTAEQVKNGVDVSVYSTLAGAMVQRVCEKYKEYVDENNAMEAMNDFFEYRDDNGTDDLVSWHLGERAVAMMGGEISFIEHCKKDRAYSVATDGIHYEFAAFNLEENDGVQFMMKKNFQYAKETLVDTVFEGMIESGFKGYMPSKEEVSQFILHDMYNGRTNQAGLSIMMWNIEQIVSHLKYEYNKYCKEVSTVA